MFANLFKTFFRILHKDHNNLDLLLVQIPNLNEPSYLVGVASLKAFLTLKSYRIECFNPAGPVISENPEINTPEFKKQFSNEIEYLHVKPAPDLIQPVVDALLAKISKTKPKYLGFSLIYGNVKNTLYYSAIVKQKFPDLPVFFGGPGVKMLNAQSRPETTADFIIHGDGELTLLELLPVLNKTQAKPWSEIPGLEYRENGSWKKNCDRPTEKSLKDYPQPDYSDFESDPCAKEMLRSRPISLGRGCPFRCRFCAVKNYGLNYRHYEVDACIEFLRQEVAKGHKHFFVHDPITNGNPFWLRSFCEALIKANLDITWGGSIRLTKYLNETKTLDLLFAAGFRTMISGLESAAPNVLRHMKKFENMDIVDEIYEKIREFKKQYPIKICLQLIVGYPNETEADFQMTLDFVKRHRGVVDEIISCSSFLMIQSENDDLMAMTHKREFGMNVISEANWATIYSNPVIRNERMQRAEATFKELGIPYRMFYNEFFDHIDDQYNKLAEPIISKVSS